MKEEILLILSMLLLGIVPIIALLIPPIMGGFTNQATVTGVWLCLLSIFTGGIIIILYQILTNLFN